MFRVYVAGKFGVETNKRVKEVQAELRAAGHRITFDWTNDQQSDGNATQAMNDMMGVLNADVFVLIAEDHTVVYNGAVCELGMAIAAGLPIYVLGNALDTRREGVQGPCIFMRLPQILREDAYRADLLEDGLGDEHKRDND